MSNEVQNLIRHLYYYFNQRDHAKALELVAFNGKWANSWEGGYSHGHLEIRNFWSRYWKAINVYSYPIRIKTSRVNFCEVLVVRVIKDDQGRTIDDSILWHYFTFRDNLIKQFDLEKTG